MIPPPFVANRHVDAVVHANAGIVRQIDIASFSGARGFGQFRLTRDETPGFDTALRFLKNETIDGPPVSAAEVMTLWQVGLIVMPQDLAEPFVSPDAPEARGDFEKQGFAILPRLVTVEATGILVKHYRAAVADGKLALGDRQANRHFAHNDPAGRVALRALQPAVEQIVGRPLNPTYSYASLYDAGADLPKHRDRSQCRYTLSLQIDHQPLPQDSQSPWPVYFHLEPERQPVACFQMIGGGVLFLGCEIPHERPVLPPGQDSWVLLLHYVDTDFAGSLD